MYVKPTPLDMPPQVHLGKVAPAEVNRIRRAARGTRGSGRSKQIGGAVSQAPGRVQLRRERGWTLPASAVAVARPSRWGNPFPVTKDDHNAASVAAFREFLTGDRRYVRDNQWVTYPSDGEIRRALAGRDLACWCWPRVQCHADVLLEIANEPETDR